MSQALGRLALLLAVVLGSACTALPPRPPLAPQTALPAATQGALAARFEPLARAHPGVSGFVPLESGADAFAARLWLADRAAASLDVQCYIWRDDRSGRWLLARLAAAAERGVRVRLLLDDNHGSPALDEALAQLDAHPAAEVRLFNPFRSRGFGRRVELIADLPRLNRRMHNKSFTADGRATILGGRNVGDEYFGIADPMQFADLDVLGIGPIAPQVAKAFDAYWNSESAWPLAVLREPGRPAPPNAGRLAEDERYARAIVGRPQVERWRADGPRDDDIAWARATLLVDPPDKALGEAGAHELVMPKLERALGRAERSIDLVSPYFVPSADAIDAYRALHERGVRLRVLTNSLAATDVAAVHAGYADRRVALLEAGVELYELKPTPGSSRSGRLLRAGSSREASLHAKTFAVDGERIYIGSLNFDPRSAWLNTEIGVLLEHAGLARRIGLAFDQEVPRDAWRVSLQDGRLRWSEATPEGPAEAPQAEPGASWPLRWWTWMLSWLPIDGLL
ncbi:MAG TPA: phospholipase D family protein [Methylibium sp.]|uniref:phospholipase D family protein n=1 Tax=Methylibium sp. TaxID=2067992 RepID=UPI002DBC0B10|nr:phospholipase D family protein [Methylibium sp.]HEU4458488.1 phospholipase D family protein [Methylibium sp.]